MTDTPRTPRKTLGLPPRAEGETAVPDPRRKPLRGGSGSRKPSAHPNAGRTGGAAGAGDAPAAPGKARAKARDDAGDKPRGKPPVARSGAAPSSQTPRSGPRPAPGASKAGPRGGPRGEPRGESGSGPRSVAKDAPRGETRSGPRGESRSEPRSNPRNAPGDAPRKGPGSPAGSAPRGAPGGRPQGAAKAGALAAPWAGAKPPSRSERSERPPAAAKPRAAAPRPAAARPAFDAGGEAPSGVRVSKLMAERGLCSRREADAFIERGWVFVDGERVSELGTRVDPAAKITLANEARATQQRQMTILLNKPVGYVSGQPEPGFTPAVTLIQPEAQYRTPDTPLFHPTHLKGLAPAGRLDIDSTGLLVLTQDGRVARQLIGEDSTIDKEYLVRVEGDLLENGLALLNHGLSLDGKPLRPAKVEWLNEDQLRFVLREGKKRQIRRMCELVGLKVVGLKRIRIGAVRLGDLPVGQWRYLREDESF